MNTTREGILAWEQTVVGPIDWFERDAGHRVVVGVTDGARVVGLLPLFAGGRHEPEVYGEPVP